MQLEGIETIDSYQSYVSMLSANPSMFVVVWLGCSCFNQPSISHHHSKTTENIKDEWPSETSCPFDQTGQMEIAEKCHASSKSLNLGTDFINFPQHAETCRWIMVSYGVCTVQNYLKICSWTHSLFSICIVRFSRGWCCGFTADTGCNAVFFSSCLWAMTLGGLNWFPLACFVADTESLWTSARSVWHPNPLSDSFFPLLPCKGQRN